MSARIDFPRDELLAIAAVIRNTADESCEDILRAAHCIACAFSNGKKLLLCGNGGSCADCQHMACEFTSRMSKNITRPALPAIALTTDTSFLTGHTNDFDFGSVFSRQVEALGASGDVLLAISTSGNSVNVLVAVEAARDLQIHTIGLTGCNGKLREMVDVAICIPSGDCQHIQAAHIAVEHAICGFVERELFPSHFEHADVSRCARTNGAEPIL